MGARAWRLSSVYRHETAVLSTLATASVSCQAARHVGANSRDPAAESWIAELAHTTHLPRSREVLPRGNGTLRMSSGTLLRDVEPPSSDRRGRADERSLSVHAGVVHPHREGVESSLETKRIGIR